MQSNLQSLLTDCPHREKLGWLEVSHLLGPAIFFNYDVPLLYEKICDDIAEAQLPNGLVPDIAPEYTVFSGGFRDSPEWGSASVLNPWLLHRFYGQSRVLEKHYTVMEKYVAYLSTRATNNILNHGLGDWYDIGPRPPGESQLTSRGFTATALYYQDLQALSQMAAQLSKTNDAVRYAAMACQVRTAFNQKFFHPNSGQYDRGSQTALAMPLVLGLVPGESRAALVEQLAAQVRNGGHRVTAGDVGFVYLVRALHQGGRNDALFDLVTQTNGPGYADQLRKGATALTEAWDANPSSSQNHCMLGHADEWFYTGLAGINLDDRYPAFKRFRIRPELVGNLHWVRARYHSPYGMIESHWDKSDSHQRFRVRVPPNTSAEVWVPRSPGAVVVESGKPATQSRGVRFLADHNHAAVFEIQSGQYDFTVQ